MTERFHIPDVSRALKRPRLFALMDQDPGIRLFLVTGQAAQGKSTLVASYLTLKAQQTLWFHLTPEISGYTDLFELLAAGLGEKLGISGAHPVQATLGVREDLLRQNETLAALLTRVEFPLNIVLDDLEALEENAGAFTLIQNLVGTHFDNVRFFLLSRTRPDISFSPLKMEHRFLNLSNRDLAFDRDEIRQFFSRGAGKIAHGVPNSPEQHLMDDAQIRQIHEITEGWPGGLALVSETLRRSGDVGKLPRQMSAQAFSFFSDEIYSGLSGSVRDFLMKTAVFELLDTRILNNFFEPQNTAGILKELESRNLFIQKIDPDPQWPVYKYNRLFREFLFSDLLQHMGRQAVEVLEKRAGLIFWEEKRHEEAAGHFIRAKAFRDLARLIRIKGTGYVVTGQVMGLSAWLDKMPEDLVSGDPWLMLFKAMTRRIKGGRQNYKDLIRAHKLFEAAEDSRGIILSTAFIIEAAVFIRQPSHSIGAWIDKGQTILKQRKGNRKYTWARALLWQHIGLGYIAGTGNLPMGISACRNAVLLARGIGNQELLLNASIVMILGLVQTGDFRKAGLMLDEIKGISKNSPHPEYRALQRLTRLDYDLKMGHFDQADKLLDDSQTDIDTFGLIFLYPGFVEARAVFFAGIRDFRQALVTADHLSDFSILEGNDFYLGISHRLKAMVHILEQNHEQALEQATLAVKELGGAKRGDIHYFLTKKIFGTALFYNEQFDAAVSELQAAMAYFETISSDLDFCEAGFMAGLSFWRNGDKTQAETLLKAAITKALENNYTYFPLVCHRDLARVMVVLARTGNLLPARSFLTAGQTADLGIHVREQISMVLDTLPSSKQSGQADTFRSLYRAGLPKIKITTLGGFSVQIGDSPLDNSSFEGAKPRQLLKTIILNRLSDIPREILIDSLWPNATPEAGEKNLKVNLHRLRKALEPQPDKRLGYFYVVQKAGLVSLDPDLVVLDSIELSHLAAKAGEMEARNQPEQALGAYTRAAELCRGEYFMDDPYLEGVAGIREMLLTQQIEILERKARLHEELDQWQEAVDTWQAVLKLTSCAETAFRNLMILHADKGLKQKALEFYAQCCTQLKNELDAEPGSRTREIFQKVKKL